MLKNLQHHIKKGSLLKRLTFERGHFHKPDLCFSWLNFGAARKRNVILFSYVSLSSESLVGKESEEVASLFKQSIAPGKGTEASRFLPNSKKKSIQVNYTLENFQRSNQDTCLTHKPAVFEGNWVQSGDLLTDCASSVGGELSLGQNLLIAYMPWEGYNFEDAILISERLVMDDLYTSVHIERYELQVHQTKLGVEEITQNIPDISQKEIQNLDSFGIVKIGTWVEEGDILVGKITPINKKKISPYQKLLYTILEKQVKPFKDSSLRAPRGIKAKVIDIKYFFKSAKNPLLLSTFSPSRSAPLQGKKEEEGRREFSSPSGIERSNSRFPAPKGMGLPFEKAVETNDFMTNIGISKQQISSSRTKNRNGKSPNLDPFNLKTSDSLGSPAFFHPTSIKLSSTKKTSLFSKRVLKSEKTRYLEQSREPFFGPRPAKDSPEREGWQLEDSQIPIALSVSPVQENKVLQKSLLLSKKVRSKKVLLGMTTSFLPTDKKKHISFLPIKKNFPFVPFVKKIPSFLSYSLRRRNEQEIGKQTRQQTISVSSQSYLNELETHNSNRGFLKLKHKLGKVSTIHIYLAEKRKIQVGDKMAGRHGNKGIVSQILPIHDMPYLPDGSPIDMVLNPLGVPSRMNVGQIYECLLGLAGKYLGEHFKVFAFDEMYGSEASRSFVFSKLYEASKKTGFKWLFDPNAPGKIRLYDGRNGECFHQKVTVGQAYMLRLVHMVDDKMHMRSTGPYSLVTQQPLRGRSKQGGQRLGEMEVWALEGYGAAFTLLEMLTIKSDDMTGRMTLWSNLILNKEIAIGTPESFKVLVCELQALCLDIGLYRLKNTQQQNNLKSPEGMRYKTSLKEIDKLINLP